MHLRAKVWRVTGKTRHISGADGVDLPRPGWVDIVFENRAYFLFYLDENKQPLNDSWHETLDEAKAQAKFEFEIEDANWFEVVTTEVR